MKVETGGFAVLGREMRRLHAGVEGMGRLLLALLWLTTVSIVCTGVDDKAACLHCYPELRGLNPGIRISFLTSLWRASTQTGDFVQAR